MGLPTSIPSGGEGRDRFSTQPAVPAPSSAAPRRTPRVEENKPAIKDTTEVEFEEFQRWRREREALAAQTPPKAAPRSPRTSPDAPESRASQATQTKSALPKIAIQDELSSSLYEDESEGQWSVDTKTGKSYKTLPSTPKEALAAYKKTRGAGLSLSEMKALLEVEEDFNIDDLNGTAETFMAHLRVPPSAEEREEILRKKSELAKRQKAERAELDQELNDREGAIEEPELDPFRETAGKKRGLFGRKN